MTDFTFDELSRSLGSKAKADTACPVCGPGCKFPFNRRRKVLRLWSPRPGFISWNCARCGIKGGIGDGSTRRIDRPPPSPAEIQRRIDQEAQEAEAAADTLRYVHGLFKSAMPLKGTPAELYLNSRAILLEEAGNLHHVLRFAPMLMLDSKKACGIIALFRDILTNEPRGIHRIFLDADGRRLDRLMLGPVGGAAIKLDPDEEVTMGLHVGEGIETCLAARQLGMRPTWAVGSANAIGDFPILSGIEAITVLGERDEDGRPNKANLKAVMKLGERYSAAGLEMILADPPAGDMADALKKVVVQ